MDSGAGGEPARIVPSGGPDLGGGSVAGKLKDLVSSRMKARLRCAAFRGTRFFPCERQ